MKRSLFSIILASLSLVATTFAAADGIAINNYGEVLVENLQIGSQYSMTKLVNLPLVVVNQSPNPSEIKLTVVKPTPEGLKAGFEAIPDISWVKLEAEEVTIPANGTYRSDVLINIPNKSAHLGKKYQVNFLAATKPPVSGAMTIAMAVQGRMLFTIAPVKQKTVGELKTANIDFVFEPARVEVKELALGKKVEIMAPEQKPTEIKNRSQEKMVLNLSSLNVSQTVVKPDPGYEATPQADFLTFKEDEITINPGATAPFKMMLEIPDKPEYQGKNFEFVVSADTGNVTAGKRYLRVMVSTVGK